VLRGRLCSGARGERAGRGGDSRKRRLTLPRSRRQTAGSLHLAGNGSRRPRQPGARCVREYGVIRDERPRTAEDAEDAEGMGSMASGIPCIRLSSVSPVSSVVQVSRSSNSPTASRAPGSRRTRSPGSAPSRPRRCR
jgi:hypothetical protein